jgi:hypothetical protein
MGEVGSTGSSHIPGLILPLDVGNIFSNWMAMQTGVYVFNHEGYPCQSIKSQPQGAEAAIRSGCSISQCLEVLTWILERNFFTGLCRVPQYSLQFFQAGAPGYSFLFLISPSYS